MAIDQSEQNIQRLVKIYEDAEKKLERAIKKLDPKKPYSQTRRDFLGEIERIKSDLIEKSKQWSEKTVDTYYDYGSRQAVKQIADFKAKDEIDIGFTRADTETVSALLTQNTNSFAETMQGLTRSGERYLNDIRKQRIINQIASNIASGASVQKAQADILDQIKQSGFTAFTDRGGRSWTLSQYAKMLGRTMTMKARNEGALSRLLKNGTRWVKISHHGDSFRSDICNEYEDKIVDLADPQIPLPPYHPNCRHTIQYVDPVELEGQPGVATNNAEAESYAKENFSKSVNYKGVDLTVSNRINRTLQDEFDKMNLPKLRIIKAVDLPDGMIAQFRLRDAFGSNVNGLFINRKLLENNASVALRERADAIAFLKSDQKRAIIDELNALISSLKNEIKNVTDPAAVQLAQQKMLGYTSQIEAVRNASRRPFYDQGDFDIVQSSIRHEIGHYIASLNPDAIEKAKNIFYRLDLKPLSEYAKKSADEMFAEAYSAWSVGDYKSVPDEMIEIFNNLAEK